MSDRAEDARPQGQRSSSNARDKGGNGEIAARYKAIFEQSVDGVAILDSEGRFIDFNGAACKNLGYTPDEFAAMAVSDVEAAESAEDVLQHIANIARDGYDRFESLHRAKGGEIKNVLVTSQMVSFDGKHCFVSTWRDVTEGHLARQALEQKNAALLEMLDQVQQAKDHVGRQVSDNLEKVILPMMDDLMVDAPSDCQGKLLAIKNSLEDILSPFAKRLSDAEGLSPGELRICQLIRSGIPTKEIARIEHLSPATVSKHRENIRRKLGIQGEKTNLANHLDKLLSE